MRQRAIIGLAAVALLTIVSCRDDASSSPTAAVATTAPSATASPPTSAAGPAVAAGKPFPADRCAANKAAGTIHYLSGFDFAASASIIDVVVAQQAGYFKDLC